MTWNAARQYCRERYTDLASVRNEDENEEIKRMIPMQRAAWIGLWRDPWRWSNQEDPKFKHWITGSIPYVGGNCAASRFDPENNGKWVVNNCKDKLSFLCHSGELLSFLGNTTLITQDYNSENPVS